MDNSPHILPEHIRVNLSKFNSHTHLTCLECGYVGLMGIRKEKSPIVFAQWVGLGLVFFVLAFFISFFSVVLLGIVAGFLIGFLKKKKVTCPNCGKDLTEK